MKAKKTRSPLDRATPLRAAGQSLSEELEDVAYDHILTPLFVALVVTIIAVLEWIKYANNLKPNPVIYTSFAAVISAYAAFKIW